VIELSIPTLDGSLAQDVSDCRVLVRSDLDVPSDHDGHVTDRRRIVAVWEDTKVGSSHFLGGIVLWSSAMSNGSTTP
jgi:3-phosphoglycerate kinase